MEMNKLSNRIHPLIAGAAVSVMLVSLVGIAALTGHLPNSHASVAENGRIETQTALPVTTPAQQFAAVPAADDQAPVHKSATHRHHVQHVSAPNQQYAQAPVNQQPAPVYQQPAPVAPVAQNSPIGIGIGAVVGGLLGNQVGGGKGKTLATIAGAVGGGYAGNEIAKRYP
jgi:uncharacterized protein YcfJ